MVDNTEDYCSADCCSVELLMFDDKDGKIDRDIFLFDVKEGNYFSVYIFNYDFFEESCFFLLD